MKLLRFIFPYIKHLFNLLYITLRHSTYYLIFVKNIQIAFISDAFINLGFFTHGVFNWFITKVVDLKYSIYLFNGNIKKRSLFSPASRNVFRGIYRKKRRKPLRLDKLISRLNYFKDCYINSLELNKIFASVTIYIVFIGLLILAFRYYSLRLKRKTLQFLNTEDFKQKLTGQIKENFRTFIKMLNTLDIIKVFIKSKKVYRKSMSLFLSFYKIIKSIKN